LTNCLFYILFVLAYAFQPTRMKRGQGSWTVNIIY